MAVTAAAHPLRNALQPTPGMLRWIALRMSVLVLSSLPALVLGLSGVSSGVARRPYYTGVTGPLPLVHLIRLFKDLPGSFGGAAAVGVVLAILGDQMLTGAAFVMFDPERPREPKVRVLAALFRDGLAHLWAFLRAVVLSLVLMAIGLGLVAFLSGKLSIAAYQKGWTGETIALKLTLLTSSLGLVWMASVGAWTFWCRLLTVADSRVRVRRTGLLVLRVFWRHPLRSWGVFTALTLATTLASGAVLVAWRRAEPRTAAGVLACLLGWLAMLFLQSFVWLWLLRAGRLLYSSEALADVRNRPDASFALFSRLAFWRKKTPIPAE